MASNEGLPRRSYRSSNSGAYAGLGLRSAARLYIQLMRLRDRVIAAVRLFYKAGYGDTMPWRIAELRTETACDYAMQVVARHKVRSLRIVVRAIVGRIILGHFDSENRRSIKIEGSRRNF